MMTNQNFNDMLLSLQGNMLNFALILTSDRNAAYTLLQQATLMALEESDAYDGNPESFKPWVFAIMRRLSARSKYGTQPVAEIEPDRIKALASAATDIPEGCVSIGHIDQSLEEIDDHTTRRVITMHLTGWASGEISDETGIAHKSVMAHIHRGVRHLLTRIVRF